MTVERLTAALASTGLPLDEAVAEPAAPQQDSAAGRLVALVREHYRLVSDRGTAYVVPKTGPRVARPLGSIRPWLSKAYTEAYARVPPTRALQDALTALHGMAEDEPERLFFRVARLADRVVLDLGAAGFVHVTAGDWEVLPTSPVTFRRSKVQADLPTPPAADDGPFDLARLARLLNMSGDDAALVLAWWVYILLHADEPAPLLYLAGPPGAGKTVVGRFIRSLLDPSHAPLLAAPGDLRDWETLAHATYVIALDNVSKLAPGFSDTLARVVTGIGAVHRKLYSDADPFVLSFIRPVLLTGIEIAGIKDDLADRMLRLNLAIPERRVEERRIRDEWDAYAPTVLAAVLDLAARLADCPEHPAESRMVAFESLVTEMGLRDHYRDRLTSMAEDALHDDLVAAAVLALVDKTGEYEATAADWRDQITLAVPQEYGRFVPQTPRAMTSRIMTMIPLLARAGYRVEHRRSHGGTRLLRVVRMPGEAAPYRHPNGPTVTLPSPLPSPSNAG